MKLKFRFVYMLIFLGLAIGVFFLSKSFYQFWDLTDRSDEVYSEDVILDEQKQVVFITEKAGHPYWEVVLKGAKLAAGDEIWLDYQGPSQSSPEEHTKLIERAIASNVDGIITQGLDESFIPVINKAIDANIPVITIDTDAPQSNRIAFVGTDNYAAGLQVGNYVKRNFTGPAKIGIISGNYYGGHMQLRIKGFKDALKDHYDFQIVSTVNSQINKLEAAHQAYKMLKENPEINLMFGVSALDAPGITSAIEKSFPEREIFIIGFDDMPESVEMVEKGQIQAIVVQRSFHMGYKSVQLMRKVFNGEPITPIHYTDTFILEKSTLTYYFRQKEAEERGGFR